MSRSWLIRLGKFGEQESHALETGELATGWIIEDVMSAQSREEIAQAVERAYPNEKSGTIKNWAVQLNQFRNEITEGDLTITPMKTTGQVAIGRVTGGFRQSSDNQPTRTVEWLRTDLPRDAIKQDLVYSLGASQTICEISRNDAAARFRSLAETGKDPGPNARTPVQDRPELEEASTHNFSPPACESKRWGKQQRDSAENFFCAAFKSPCDFLAFSQYESHVSISQAMVDNTSCTLSSGIETR